MTEQRKNVAIIGSGNVGANAALLSALSGTADIALVDIAEGLAAGKALDISQALAILGLDDKVVGGEDYALIDGADIVVMTAGLARKPGMSRTDLLHKNAAIVTSAAAQIKARAPEAIVIVVTNPLDAMAYLVWRETGFPSERVMGMGGLLDTGRFINFLAEAADVDRSTIEAIVVGAHGDEMVPVSSLATTAGAPFTEALGDEELAAAAEKTRHGGAELVGLLKTGSAAYGPGAAVSMMVNAILADDKRVLSVCCLAQGQFGQSDIYLNLPAVLGAGGVERIIELDLQKSERLELAASAASVRALLNELERND